MAMYIYFRNIEELNDAISKRIIPDSSSLYGYGNGKYKIVENHFPTIFKIDGNSIEHMPIELICEVKEKEYYKWFRKSTLWYDFKKINKG